jgi:very-short-patch-repair endonuclease
VDRGLARIVDRQGGVLTREQALSAGTPNEVRARLRRGTWRRTPWRGVYVDGELPDDGRIVVRAAALWLGGDLVACHSTAAFLWGFDLRPPAAVATDDLHFLAPGDVDNRRLGRLQVHPSSLGTDDAVLRHGVWCTPPNRTACDVARLGRPVDTLAVLDAALAGRTCSPDGLAAAAAAQAGLREVVRLRALVPHADARSESPMESRMRWRFIAAGLPAPQLQVQVGDRPRRHRLDTAWEEHRLGAEFDGLEAHMTREQLAADRDRHNWLTERGWRLLHFTAVDVYREHERMVAAVRRHLGRAPLRAIMAP